MSQVKHCIHYHQDMINATLFFSPSPRLSRILHLHLTVGQAKVGGDGLLCLQLLAQLDGLDAVEAVEEANLDDARQPDQLLGEGVDLPDAVLSAAVDLLGDVLGQEQRGEGGVDQPHAVVGDALASLAGEAGADGRVGRAHGPKTGQDVRGSHGEDLDGDGLPCGAEPGGLLSVVYRGQCLVLQDIRRWVHTGHSDELVGRNGNELLLEQTSTAALDEVEVLVDLVSAVKGNVEGDGDTTIDGGPLVEVGQLQAGGADEALGLASGGDKGHAGVKLGPLADDGLDDVDDGAAGADADVLVLGEEVVIDGLVGGLLLGRLDEVC